MNLTTRIPLLASLPKVELAKLLGEMEVLEFDKGATIIIPEAPNEWLYFVVDGEVEVVCKENRLLIPLILLGPGEVFGQSIFSGKDSENFQVRALTHARVCRLPQRRFARLLETDQVLAREFITLLAARLADTTQELARVKLMLASYVEEVWHDFPSPQVGTAAAAISGSPLPSLNHLGLNEPNQPQPTLANPTRTITPGTTSVTVVLGAAIALLAYQVHSGSPPLAIMTAILLWAACNWLLGIIPEYVTALAAISMATLTGIVTPAVAFSGFANSAWFLLLGVMGIGVAVSRSGLIYRIALHMLHSLPPTYRGQSFALALTGLLFTPLLPSSISRAAIGSPLARELGAAMHFPQPGKGTAGLAMSSFLGFGQMYFMFLNGGNICMLVWSLLPGVVREQITWVTWLWYVLPLGLLTFGGCYAAILLMYPPEPTAGVSRQTIAAQLKVLGPVSRTERITAWVIGLVLVGFIAQGLHGIDPALLALPGFLVLVALGVIDKSGLKEMDWSFLLLIGALLGLSDVMKATGLNDQLGLWIGPFVRPFAGNSFLFLGAVSLLTLVIRLAIPLQQTVLLMVVALLPISTQMNFNPFIVSLVVLALSNSWILPQQNQMYLTVYSSTDERSFTHKQVQPLALVQAGVGVLAVLASVPVWRLLGLLPK